MQWRDSLCVLTYVALQRPMGPWLAIGHIRLNPLAARVPTVAFGILAAKGLTSLL